MATYAIGDLHGQAAALRALLAQLEPLLEPADTILFLGDYLDRGPDSRGCLDELLALRERAPCRVEALLGNHEEWFLRTLADPRRHSWLLGMEGLATVRSYSPAAAEALAEQLRAAGPALLRGEAHLDYEPFFAAVPPAHLELLRGLPSLIRTPEVVGVHGGAEAGLPLAEQEERSLIWGGAGFPDEWRGERLVYGHRNDAWVSSEGIATPRVNPSETAYGIDAVARGVLLCLRFPDLRCFQAFVKP